MNIPNLLTIIRILLIPVFLIIFYSNIDNSLIYSILIFILSGITDVLDGYIARKKNLITKLGIILDPLADKLMLSTVLICLAIKNYIPSWVPIIVLIKEVAMLSGGIILYNKNTVIPSNKFGKLSTFMFYISISILYFNNTIAIYMLYISIVSALIAFLSYLNNYVQCKKDLQK